MPIVDKKTLKPTEFSENFTPIGYVELYQNSNWDGYYEHLNFNNKEDDDSHMGVKYIRFDLVENLITLCEKYKCNDKIKTELDRIKNIVRR